MYRQDILKSNNRIYSIRWFLSAVELQQQKVISAESFKRDLSKRIPHRETKSDIYILEQLSWEEKR